ncbi:MAG: hypothetical protein JXC36_06690 [Candidatus Atribacteria bacterium]|nr:hypothetical protein [Candidatus Atribacteria bacterium]
MKRRIFLAIILSVIVATCISFLCKGPLVQRSYALEGCYYCAWNNEYQKYECKVYPGPGYSGCLVQGTFCQGQEPYCGM